MSDTASDLGIGVLPPFIDTAPTLLDPCAAVPVMAREEAVAAAPATPTQGAQQTACEQPAREVASPVVSPLPATWLSSAKSRREVPKAAKVGAVGVGLLLVMVFAAPKACGSAPTTKTTNGLADTQIENAEHLKKRRHLTDADFRSSGASTATRTATAVPAPAKIDVRERQRLRAENPEDIRGARKRAGGKASGGNRRARRHDRPAERKSLLVFFDHDEPRGRTRASSFSDARRELLLPAASEVGIYLTHELTLRRGRATVIAKVRKGEGLPAGSKLIGKASAGRDGGVTIRFDTLVLPDGESIRASAEAFEASTGSPVLAGVVVGGSRPQESSVARSVGTDTAQRVAVGALGGGILGGAARQTFSETGREPSRARGRAVVVTLDRDYELGALFLREVTHDGR